jgi:hypothetical protein
MPNPITRSAIQSLLAWQGPGSVSLYVPTHQSGAEIRQDPIQLKNLLREATEQLVARGAAEGTAKDRLEPVEALVEDTTFWRDQGRSLAIFLGHSEPRMYSLPMEVEPIAVVSDRFYLKPLLGLMDVMPRFFVLAISQNSVRLVSATAETAQEVDLGETPTSLEEAMAFNDPEKHLEFHTRSSVRDPMGARSAEFHGQGVGKDSAQTKKDVVEFCRMVHSGLAAKLARADEPLILAGTEPTVGLYRQVNKYDNLLDEAIEGNPDRKDLDTLRREGLEIIQPRAEKRQAEILSHYEHLAGHGKAVADSGQVLQAAGNGQIEMLLVPRDGHLWGRYDAETGAAEIHADRQDEDEDLLDLAAAETCRHGGNVYAVQPEKLPDESRMAATLRFTTS